MAKTGKLVSMSEQSIMDCTWAVEILLVMVGRITLLRWLMLKNDGQVASAADYGNDMNQNDFATFRLIMRTKALKPIGNKPINRGKVWKCYN